MLVSAAILGGSVFPLLAEHLFDGVFPAGLGDGRPFVGWDEGAEFFEGEFAARGFGGFQEDAVWPFDDGELGAGGPVVGV